MQARELITSGKYFINFQVLALKKLRLLSIFSPKSLNVQCGYSGPIKLTGPVFHLAAFVKAQGY